LLHLGEIFREFYIRDKTLSISLNMITKTARTAIIIAMFSLLGVAIPAGLSQTAFAQNVAEEAVRGTPLEGFFDDEITQVQSSDPSQEQTSTQANTNAGGTATGTSSQNVEDNSIEGADCGEALICFGNDLVTEADVNADSSADENNQENNSEQDEAATSEENALTNAV
jgi:hypothetical protein